jgi:hypothetical protein
MVLAALGAQVSAPFAAYASAKAGDGFGDLCSVFGKTLPSNVLPVGLPVQGSDRHGADHCANCPGGSAAAAIIPPAMPMLQTHAPAIVALRVERDPSALLFSLLPPSRAPPTAA